MFVELCPHTLSIRVADTSTHVLPNCGTDKIAHKCTHAPSIRVTDTSTHALSNRVTDDTQPNNNANRPTHCNASAWHNLLTDYSAITSDYVVSHLIAITSDYVLSHRSAITSDYVLSHRSAITSDYVLSHHSAITSDYVLSHRSAITSDYVLSHRSAGTGQYIPHRHRHHHNYSSPDHSNAVERERIVVRQHGRCNRGCSSSRYPPRGCDSGGQVTQT
jgi:hypothetical protein